MKLAPLALSVCLLAGCVTPRPLTDAEKTIRILRRSDPEKGCKELGKIHAPGNYGLSTQQYLENELRRATSALGGNVAAVDRVDPETGTTEGTAYLCP